jgi:hypothetical protein
MTWMGAGARSLLRAAREGKPWLVGVTDARTLKQARHRFRGSLNRAIVERVLLQSRSGG